MGRSRVVCSSLFSRPSSRLKVYMEPEMSITNRMVAAGGRSGLVAASGVELA